MIDFNTEPYNDDFDEEKRFYKILYRPSFAVQARELTQMQSILQNQIKRFGDGVFKQGAMVIPGQASVKTVSQPGKGINYVKLQALYNGVAVETFLSSLQGKTIVGQTTGMTAQVVQIEHASGSDPSTLYINYTNSGSNNNTTAFADGEIITSSDSLQSQPVTAQTPPQVETESILEVETKPEEELKTEASNSNNENSNN